MNTASRARSAPALDATFAHGLQAIDWLSRCGQPLAGALPLPVVQVADAAQALDGCADPDWEAVTLEARNRLTVFLHTRHRDAYQRWNTIAIQARDAVVQPLATRVWQPLAAGLAGSAQGGQAMVGCMTWDVLAALLEQAYDLPRRPRFFLDLLEVYRAGHLPCGWDGAWPQGRLRIW